jgi:hypothetical protein
LTIKAANEGAWGNKLDVVITNSREDPDNEFTLQVLRDNVTPSLPPLLLETHENLSMNPDSVNFVEKVVAANSRYLVVEATKTNQSTAPEGTSQSGRLPVGNGAGELRLGKKKMEVRKRQAALGRAAQVAAASRIPPTPTLTSANS